MAGTAEVSSRARFAVLGAIGGLAVLVAGLGIVAATRNHPMPASDPGIAISISDTACTPSTVTVAAGSHRFSITNTSARVTEWEILDGVMVLVERENILPGTSIGLTPTLKPGIYQMTCGLLANPRGTLTVTAADGTTTAASAPPKLADLVAPTGEYRVYAIAAADDLGVATAALSAAIAANDLPAARLHAAAAITAFSHLAPVVSLFGHDGATLASGPAALDTLGKSLDTATSASGLAATVATAAQGAIALGSAVRTTTAGPRDIIAGAAAVVANIAGSSEIAVDGPARIAGVRKVIELFRPLTLRSDRALSAKLDADLAAVEAVITGSPGKSTISAKTPLAALGADLTALLAALSLTAN
jgi:iron uptake system component EfeO